MTSWFTLTPFLTSVYAAQRAALQQYNALQIGEVEGEPITLEEARAQCRVDTYGSPPESDDDFWFENIGIPAARSYCENYKGVSYAPRVVELVTNSFPTSIPLPFGPVQSVESIMYDDATIAQAAYDAAYTAAYDTEFGMSADVDAAIAAGVAAGDIAYAANLEQTVDTSVYTLNAYTIPATLGVAYGQTWPTARTSANSVRIRYVTGFNLPDESPLPYPLPKSAKAAMLLMLGHLFENREGVTVGGVVSTMPMGVHALLDLTPGGERTGFA